MANVHSKLSVVMIDGDDISAFTNSTTFESSADSHDVTTYGKSAHVYSYGLLDGKITIGGFYDTAAGGPRATIKPLQVAGLPVEFTWRPHGTGSTKAQTLVDVVVTSYNESSPVADMVQWTAELQMTDAPVDTAQA